MGLPVRTPTLLLGVGNRGYTPWAKKFGKYPLLKILAKTTALGGFHRNFFHHFFHNFFTETKKLTLI